MTGDKQAALGKMKNVRHCTLLGLLVPADRLLLLLVEESTGFPERGRDGFFPGSHGGYFTVLAEEVSSFGGVNGGIEPAISSPIYAS